MPSRDFIACTGCQARIILVRGCPPIDWAASTDGAVAVEHTAAGAWKARFLARGEQPVAGLEKRHAVHHCPETAPLRPADPAEALQGVAFLDAFRQAKSKAARDRRTSRGRRAAPGITGVRRRTDDS